MKTNLFLNFLIALSLTTGQLQGQSTFTQLNQFMNFDSQTPAQTLNVNLGSNFKSSQAYSVWGWIQPAQTFPMITNVLTLYNGNSTQAAGAKGDAILYVNYDLQPVKEGQSQTYNLTFIYKNGESEYKQETFEGIKASNALIFFAFSADYLKGRVQFYMKSYDGVTEPLSANSDLNFPGFQLNNGATLALGEVADNEVFTTLGGFKGQVGFVEMSSNYENDLTILGVGYQSQESKQYQGNLVDFNFDVQNKASPLMNSGHLSQKQFTILGNYQPLKEIDSTQSGVKFNDQSYLNIDNVSFSQGNSPVQSALFMFEIEYQEPLPDNYMLIQRGQQGQPGFLAISLKKEGNGRVVVINAENNPNSLKPAVYESTSSLEPLTKHLIMAGVAQDMGKSLRAVYTDNKGGNTFSTIKENAQFNFDALPIQAFKNDSRFAGNVIAKRLIILDSASPAVNYIDANQYVLVNEVPQNQIIPKNNYCLVSSVYGDDQSCQLCNPETTIATENKLCFPYCPLGYKNVNGVCVLCTQNEQQETHIDFCREID